MDSSKKMLTTKNDGDIVLLLGAGASSYLGLPTLDSILDNEVSSGSSKEARMLHLPIQSSVHILA